MTKMPKEFLFRKWFWWHDFLFRKHVDGKNVKNFWQVEWRFPFLACFQGAFLWSKFWQVEWKFPFLVIFWQVEWKFPFWEIFRGVILWHKIWQVEWKFPFLEAFDGKCQKFPFLEIFDGTCQKISFYGNIFWWHLSKNFLFWHFFGKHFWIWQVEWKFPF